VGTQSAGLMAAQYGAMVKRMHAGRTSQSGLYGALFAARGLTGIVNVFESEYGGFCSTFSRSNNRFNLEELTGVFGDVWQTMGITLKFYACVSSNHSTLDAIRLMQQERHFGAADVKKMIVNGSQVTMDHVGWTYCSQGLTSAQLNLPYCVATWLLEGDCFVDQFTEAMVADLQRMLLAEKVEVRHDAEITARGLKLRHMVRVERELNDGTRMSRVVEAGRGNEKNFASEADVVEKFHKLAAWAIPKVQAEQVVGWFMTIEKCSDASELPRLLTPL